MQLQTIMKLVQLAMTRSLVGPHAGVEVEGAVGLCVRQLSFWSGILSDKILLSELDPDSSLA